jgi:hypothetical protein
MGWPQSWSWSLKGNDQLCFFGRVLYFILAMSSNNFIGNRGVGGVKNLPLTGRDFSVAGEAQLSPFPFHTGMPPQLG